MITTEFVDGRKINIDWDITNDILDRPDNYVAVHLANGVDENGHRYSGSALMSCGEFEGIENFEKL